MRAVCPPANCWTWRAPPFDFRIPKPIGGPHIEDNFEQLRRGGGYDHNYVLSGKHAATLYSPDSGIELVVETDLPGMQVYSANLADPAQRGRGVFLSPPGSLFLGTPLLSPQRQVLSLPSPLLRPPPRLHPPRPSGFPVGP